MSAPATVRFDAIGCVNQVTVVDRAALPSALAIVRAEVRAIDDVCSRFRSDSELARLNRSAGRAFAASPLLVEALTVALRAAAATDGAVDPTVGASLRALGWDRDWPLVVVSTVEPPIFRTVAAAGWRSVSLDPETGVVRLRRGTELDLGSTAKALAADRAARAAAAATGSAVLVSLGGDIAVAGDPANAWPVRVTDDSRAESGGQTAAITAGGLATSSTTVRRWVSGRIEVHHIVDPATGAPSAGYWRTVSVAATSCVDANAAATAAIVRGAPAFGRLERAGLAARLVRLDGAVAMTSRWPAETP